MSGFDPVSFARKNISYHTERDMPQNLKKINYVMRKDGLWEVRENKIGTFYVHLYEGNISGFGEEDESFNEGFKLSLPKIPRSLFNQVLAFFKKLCEDHDFEAYAQFYWSPEDEEYWVRVPQQKVSKGRVAYEPQEGIPPSNILVCEIHSHNSMRAFFSTTDDKDEKQRGDRFFGVIGRLDTKFPEMEMSFIIGGGERVSVNFDDLFEEEDFPAEWLDNVVYIDRDTNPEFEDEINPPQRYGFVKYGNPEDRRSFYQGTSGYSGFDPEYEQMIAEDEEEHWQRVQEEMEGSYMARGEDSEDIYDRMTMTSISNEEELSNWVDGEDSDERV